MKLQTFKFLSVTLLLSTSAVQAVTQEQIQNYINGYNGNYDVEKIKADAATYGVSYEQAMAAINNAPKATPAPATPPVTATTPAVAPSVAPTSGELAIDKVYAQKTEALSAAQTAELAKIQERWNTNNYTGLSDTAKKNMAESAELEKKQISSMTPDQFEQWKKYQETTPDKEYINSGSSWVVNPNYDPCYEIKNNKNGANTAENMANCSKKAGASTVATAAAKAPNTKTVTAKKDAASDLNSNAQYSESLQTMLISAGEKYAKNEITKEQFLEISVTVSKALKYSRSVANSSN